jgi:hypothetical protein
MITFYRMGIRWWMNRWQHCHMRNMPHKYGSPRLAEKHLPSLAVELGDKTFIDSFQRTCLFYF